jgi:hypothetical protein
VLRRKLDDLEGRLHSYWRRKADKSNNISEGYLPIESSKAPVAESQAAVDAQATRVASHFISREPYEPDEPVASVPCFLRRQVFDVSLGYPLLLPS